MSAKEDYERLELQHFGGPAGVEAYEQAIDALHRFAQINNAPAGMNVLRFAIQRLEELCVDFASTLAVTETRR